MSDQPAAVLRRRFLWALLVAVILAVAVAAVMAPRWSAPGEVHTVPLPELGVVPEFELLNRDGSVVRRADLLGKPWVADFIFTRCAVSCPLISQRMAQLQEGLPPGWASLVSFSVDPEHDLPEVLEEYALRYGAREEWLFLTGDPEAARAVVVDGFKLAVAPAAPDEIGAGAEPITHSDRFVLVDSEGRIRGYYNAFEAPSFARLQRDLYSLGR